MMINDAKTCNCTTNDSNSILQKTDTMFFETSKERTYTEPKDINTEIIHNHDVALAILDTLCRLASGIGINQ